MKTILWIVFAIIILIAVTFLIVKGYALMGSADTDNKQSNPVPAITPRPIAPITPPITVSTTETGVTARYR